MFVRKEEGRFITVTEYGKSHQNVMDTVVKDSLTGVLYWERLYRDKMALVPILDKDGKPMVEPVESK